MDIDSLAITTIRCLAMDAVQQANSGHPGTPMALAPLSHLLWSRLIKYNPQNPAWVDRDRFVLSCGHASILLYAQLHLAGFDLSLDEIKNFRQWGSQTPGHPEYGHTAGVETTTGPLGQGFGNAVGMAIAEKHLAARFNRPGYEIIHHHTYVLASDGDLMEGVASEAASIAGHLELGKLIVFYDDNKITIDGSTELAFSEDVAKRFEAYGWHVQKVEDANDLAALERATRHAQTETKRPSLVVVRSHIAFGSPHKQDTSEAHGSPLGDEEVRLTKNVYGWPIDQTFDVPDEVLAFSMKRAEEGKKKEHEWQQHFSAYTNVHPDLAQEYERVIARRLPHHWDEGCASLKLDEPMATRQASGKIIQVLAKSLPELIGGSADLATSNNTRIQGSPDFSPKHPEGRNLHFGIREHAMAAITNGLALHGGLLPFGATFLIFSDYMRPSLRLAAMMNIPTRYVFTHDSIGLGEDGPTHQPIEHLMSLRAIPNFTVIRPADARETLGAWKVAASERNGPIALSLTRQKVSPVPGTSPDGVAKGAYVVASEKGKCVFILLATGSEMAPAYAAWKQLSDEGVGVRLVSMPSWELFQAQPKSCRDDVLPSTVKRRLSVEAGITFGWERYVGDEGGSIGIDRFGASAPAEVSFQQFGFTKENIVARAKTLHARA